MKTTCWIPPRWAEFLAHEERFISNTSQLPELLAASSPFHLEWKKWACKASLLGVIQPRR